MEDIWEFTAKNFRYTEMETNGGARKLDFWKNMGDISKRNKNAMMYFSIDGLADTNEIYRKKVNWDKLMANIEAYIGAGGMASWKWLIFKHNEHQVEEARELAKKMGFIQFEPMWATRYDDTAYNKKQKPKTSTMSGVPTEQFNQITTGEIQLGSAVKEQVEKRLEKVKYDTSVPNISCKYIKQQLI